jgi:putative N6-adenine-specific DNA methylase
LSLRLFATAAKGTEGALRDELRELRFRGVRADRGGVHLEGGLGDALRACVWSRVAVRVLVELERFSCPDGEALYDGVSRVDWSAWLDARSTLAVRAASRQSDLHHTQYIAQRTKDAIVDRVRDRTGARPGVDRDAPDLLLFVHVVKGEATLYADASGASLHARGYRPRGSSEGAPLRETLAAAIVRLSGWDRRSALCDPMCGTGTLGVEAASWAAGIPPGAWRERFGVEGWNVADEVDRAAFRDVREAAREAARAAKARDVPDVLLRDHDARAVELARESARSAGVNVRVERAPLASLGAREAPGFLVTNPPYGERLAIGTAADDLGRVIRGRGALPSAVLAGAPSIEAAIGPPPRKWLELHNGDLVCRLLLFGDPAAARGAAGGLAGRPR